MQSIEINPLVLLGAFVLLGLALIAVFALLLRRYLSPILLKLEEGAGSSDHNLASLIDRRLDLLAERVALLERELDFLRQDEEDIFKDEDEDFDVDDVDDIDEGIDDEDEYRIYQCRYEEDEVEWGNEMDPDSDEDGREFDIGFASERDIEFDSEINSLMSEEEMKSEMARLQEELDREFQYLMSLHEKMSPRQRIQLPGDIFGRPK